MIPGQLDVAEGGAHDLMMYDAIDVDAIPPHAQAVAGYVDGHWPTYGELARRFPHTHRVAITVFGSPEADVIDCEAGDVSPGTAVAWATKQHHEGSWAPGIYASLSVWPELLERLRHAGLERRHYRVWTAHWTGTPHRCDADCFPGFSTRAGATQFANQWMGHNVDVSMAWPPFFVR